MISLRQLSLFCVLLHLLISLIGCSPGLLETDVAEDAVVSEQDLVVVVFDVSPKSKSSISPEEGAVYDLNLYAFCDGKLVAAEYFMNDVQPQLKLLHGLEYNLYALANVGAVKAPVDEDVFRRQCECRISEIDDIRNVLPMSWEYAGFEVKTLSDRVRVNFRRMVAKILFSVDKSALDGLEVNSVRLCQSPNAVWPFKYESGSRAETVADVFDGDYATQEDLKVLNDGGQIYFYSLENCQGQLLKGNDDPWGKVPENIPEQSDLCTYLEVDCSFKEGFFYSGDVTYRLYIGLDSVTDFNVHRNSLIGVSLYLTDDAIRQISWRVEADVSVNDGYADGWLSSGRHRIDDLYIGERFIYTVLLTDEMMKHLNGNPQNARLCVLGAENQVFEFGNFVSAGVSDDGHIYNVEGLCLAAGSGVLSMVDESGNILASFDDFYVQPPLLCMSDTPMYEDDEVVQSDLGMLTVPINQNDNVFYVYLVDKEGYNLNATNSPGFDMSLFEFQTEVGGFSDEIVQQMSCQVERGQIGGGGPFLRCTLFCDNDGVSHSRNQELTDKVSRGEIGTLTFIESTHRMSSRLQFVLECLPVTFTLVDNGWAGYGDCQISMLVDNPSNLILDVECWQVNSAKSIYDGATRNEIVGLYGKDFSRTRYDYVCGAFSPSQQPIYCSKSAFNVDSSDESIIRDDKCLVYPLEEISTSLIYYALLYDYFGQSALCHFVDARFCTGVKFNGFKIVDKLSNGSPTYNIIYGNDSELPGWNDRGVWLYSNGVSICKPGIDFDEYPGVTALSLSSLASGAMGQISVTYNAESNNFCASIDAPDLVGVQLNTEIVVKASGYVQTTPNGTWGKKVDNYCTATVTKKVNDIALGLTSVAVDGNALVEAMNQIYSQTFTDSKNMIGSANSYAHRAHPTSLDITLRFSLSGECSNCMIPIVVTSPTSLSYYHSQDALTYTVSINTTEKLNKVAIVENLKVVNKK